jgi:hypothetical protein
MSRLVATIVLSTLLSSVAWGQRPSYTNASLLFQPARSVDVSSPLHSGSFTVSFLLDTASADGFSFVRSDLLWSRVETSTGGYSFRLYDELVETARAYSLGIFFTLGYNNPLYCGGLSPGINTNCTQAFVDFVKAVMTRYQGNQFLWGLYSEPNLVQAEYGGLGADLGFVNDDLGWGWTNGSTVPTPSLGGGGNITQFINLLTAVGEMMLVDFPKEALVGPGLGQIFDAQYPSGQILDSSYINTLILPVATPGGGGNALRYFKAIDVHPFLGAEPEWALNEMFQLRSLIDTNVPTPGLFVPIFASAFGWSTAKPAVLPTTPGAPLVDSEDLQAAYLVRSYLIALGCGVNYTNWFEQWDAVPSGSTSANVTVGDGFGLRSIVQQESSNPGAPAPPEVIEKPAALASSFLSKITATCEFVGLLEISFLPDPDPVPPCFVTYFSNCNGSDHNDDDGPMWSYYCMVNETSSMQFSFTVDFNASRPSTSAFSGLKETTTTRPWTMLPSNEDLPRFRGASLVREEVAASSPSSSLYSTSSSPCYNTWSIYGDLLPSSPLCVNESVQPPRFAVTATAFPVFVRGQV